MCAHYQARWRLWQGRAVTAAHQRTGPVQSSLQFQSSKSRRTEAENRATGGHFLFRLSWPMQAFLLTSDDRWLPVSHPRLLFSHTLLEFHLSFSIQTIFFFFFCHLCFFTLILFVCLFWIPPPRVPIPPASSHQSQSATHVTVPGLPGMQRCPQREREKPETDREGERMREEGGGAWERRHGYRVFLLALVSQTSSDSQSGGNTHTQSHSYSHSHSLEGKPNKDSYTNTHREGEREGRKKQRERGVSWIILC